MDTVSRRSEIATAALRPRAGRMGKRMGPAVDYGSGISESRSRPLSTRPLEFAAMIADTSGMEVPGHVRDGVVVLDGNPNLPEGAVVTVSYPATASAPPAGERKRVQFPLLHSAQPGSVHLTNDRIAEIL